MEKAKAIQGQINLGPAELNQAKQICPGLLRIFHMLMWFENITLGEVVIFKTGDWHSCESHVNSLDTAFPPIK